MQTSKEQPTMTDFHMKMVEAEGKYIHVAADNYELAKQWFDENILAKNVPLDEIHPEINEGDSIYISKVENQEPLPFVSQEKEEFLKDTFLKGYDYNNESYIFSVMNLKEQRLTVQATNEEEASLKAYEVLQKQDIPATKRQEIYSCSENEVITLDDVPMDVKHEEDLTKELQKKFPKGLTVLLEDESVRNLHEYAKYNKEDNEEELRWLKGMIEAGDKQMAGAHGLLKAELRLQPEDYDILYACEDTYWSNELSDLGMETGDNATTIMLNEESELREVRIQAILSPALLKNLYIEGQPYKEVMQLMKDHMNSFIIKKGWGMSEDEILKDHFNGEYLKKIPDWKEELAYEAITPTKHKMWVEKVLPAYNEKIKMRDETYEQAAKEFGYKDIHEFKRDFLLGKNLSEQISTKIRKVIERHRELWEPYQINANKEEARFEYKKNALMRGFIEKFDQKAKQLISDVKVIQRLGTEWAVRCKVDGIQQCGKTISKTEGDMLSQRNYSTKFLSELAQKYFKDEIVSHMEQQYNQGLKR